MSLATIFDISLETANKFYTFGWKASIAGAAITFVGVSLLMWGTRVRDKDFESTISQLYVDAAKANERAAQLENDAAQAKLEVAKINERIAPRQLKSTPFVAALNAGPTGKAEILYLNDDFEAMEFAQQIGIALEAAHWQVLSRQPIPANRGNSPSTMSVGGQPSGVTIVSTLAGIDPKPGAARSAYEALHEAFIGAMGHVSASNSHAPANGVIRIVVGQKP